MEQKIKVGIIGLGQRGSGLLSVMLNHFEDLEITAVSDCYQDRREKAADLIYEKTGIRAQKFEDYRDLLKSGVETVIIAASWEAHVPIAIDSMNAGIATALEVGGAYTVQDCWNLVETYERTKTPFMFLENCCYDKTELMVTSMVRKGMLGEIVHCSGAYSHDLRDEIAGGNEKRHYRLRNYLKRNCENYPTHELGPIAKILDINRGNRMVSLVSVATKACGMKQYLKDHAETVDKTLMEKDFKQGDIVNTIITCANGETILLMLNTTLPCVYDRGLVVHGTKGMYQQSCNFAVFDGEKREELWTGIENNLKFINSAVQYEAENLPEYWRNLTDEDKKTGHGGMDGYMLREFFNHYKNGEEMPIDVYDAASWMSIACLSEESISLGGSPVMIPDFTRGYWQNRPSKDVIE